MGWRRRKAGRPRKMDAKRKPSGQIRYEPTTPPEEVVERRRALFGSDRVQAETDWLIDRAWGAGKLTDKQRTAAQRLAGLIRGRLTRIGAPKTALQPFHDGGRGGRDGAPDVEAATLDLEHLAALSVLSDADRADPGTRAAVMGAVAFECCSERDWPRVASALSELWKHFDQPRNARLARVRAARDATTPSV